MLLALEAVGGWAGGELLLVYNSVSLCVVTKSSAGGILLPNEITALGHLNVTVVQGKPFSTECLSGLKHVGSINSYVFSCASANI